MHRQGRGLSLSHVSRWTQVSTTYVDLTDFKQAGVGPFVQTMRTYTIENCATREMGFGVTHFRIREEEADGIRWTRVRQRQGTFFYIYANAPVRTMTTTAASPRPPVASLLALDGNLVVGVHNTATGQRIL